MKQTKTEPASKFWMTPIHGNESETVLAHKLAQNLRSVANFVKILTGKAIPVRFNKKDESYTDGKHVVISSKIDTAEDLDVQCGLALHEGSHCLLTDFTLLPRVDSRVPKKLQDKATQLGLDSRSFFKDLLNYVEDRRIDYYVYNKILGYRAYYKSMYGHYFHSTSVDVGLLSDMYRQETVDSYMFRIINFTNPKSDLDALNVLREIYKVLDLQNIQRLNNTSDALDVACKIGELILNAVDPQLQQKENEENEKRKQEAEANGDGDGDGEGQDPMELTDEEFDKLLDEMENGKHGSGGNGKGIPVKLTPDQMKKLQDKIKQQKDFVNGKMHKESLSDTQAAQIESISESGSELKNVGSSTNAKPTSQRSSSAGKVQSPGGFGSYNGVNCVVVHKMTRKLMEMSSFPMTTNRYGAHLANVCEDSVVKGIAKGKILGKRLKVRSEERETVFNHQRNGKVDKRRLSAVGYGLEDVFFTKEIDMYNTCNLHISVDASGSMGGSKWDHTMTTVVALCKAVDMVSNLEVQVTFRTTDNSSPYIVQAYDSRVDRFSKVTELFKYLQPGGTTPEGLCFEAIMQHFMRPTNNLDSFFLNISDGQPYYSDFNESFHYGGENAQRHTRNMVRQIEGMGIRTLSYFIGDESYVSSNDRRAFTAMYGRGASFLNVSNVSEIAKTMNRLFLTH